MFRSYIRLVVFCSIMLLGIQYPSVLADYSKRVDAHLAEAKHLLSAYQTTADEHFKGDMQKLLHHYQNSGDAVFVQDGQNIANLQIRVERLSREQNALQQPWHKVLLHLTQHSIADLRDATLKQYNFTIMLSPDAIAYGIGFAVVLSLLLDLVLSLLWMIVRPSPKARIEPRF